MVFLIYVSSDQKLIEVINKIAPEHLELNIKKYKNIINKNYKCWFCFYWQIFYRGSWRLFSWN